MKKLVIALLATLALAVVVALPASATSKEPTGTAFHMLQGTPTTFTVGAAFYIGNCWLVDPTADAQGNYTIALDVDGTPRTADFHFFGPSPIQDDALARAWYFNFRDGMSAGTHTFVAHGFTACYFAVSSLGYTGTCRNPNAVVEAATFTMTVTF